MKNTTITALRIERERRGWSRNYVAERIEADVVTVGRWERGERMPHPHYRQKLCALFEMNAQDLGLLSVFIQELNTAEILAGFPPEFPRSSQQTSSTNRKAGMLRSVSWSPNGKYLALLGHASTVEVWDPFTSRLVSQYSNFNLGLMGSTRIKWSASGTFLTCAADDGAVHVWGALTGQPRTIYRGQQNTVLDLAWSPDERHIVSASADKTCHVWEALSGRLLVIYRGHTDEIEGVDWSPCCTYIASGSKDCTAHVWEAFTGRQIA